MFCWINLHYLRPPGLRLPVICKELSHKCFRCIQILPRILKLLLLLLSYCLYEISLQYTQWPVSLFFAGKQRVPSEEFGGPVAVFMVPLFVDS